MDDQRRTVAIAVTASTANNGITPIFNTRVGLTDTASSTATTGSGRPHKWINWWLVVPHIYVTGQNVTLSFETLQNGAWAACHNNDAPSGLAGGDNTITASASLQEGFAWRIITDSNCYVTNGSTGPTIHDYGQIYLCNYDPSPGTY